VSLKRFVNIQPSLCLLLVFICCTALIAGDERLPAASATCSSQYSPQHDPARVFDGDLATNWVARKVPCWIQLDLGKPRRIGRIVWNADRGMGYSLRTPTAYHFLTSTTGKFAGEEKVVASEEHNRDAAMVTHVFKPVKARFVRMEILSTCGPRHLEPSIDEIWVHPPYTKKRMRRPSTVSGVAVRFGEFRPDRARVGRGFECLRSRGTVYVYFKNNRVKPLRCEEFYLDGVPFKELAKTRKATWWCVRPNPVPAGAVAELAAHVRAVPGESLRVGLGLPDGKERFEANVLIVPQRFWIDFVAFDEELTEIYVYVRAVKGTYRFRRLTFNGKDISERARLATMDFGRATTPIVVSLQRPLRKGQHLVIELEASGVRTGIAVRAFPSIFPFLLCSNKPFTHELLEAIKDHCHSGAMSGLNILTKGGRTSDDFAGAVKESLEGIFRYGLDFAFYGRYSGHACEPAVGEIGILRPDGTPLTIPEHCRSTSDMCSDGLQPGFAFDGNPATKWIGGRPPTWIQIDLGKPQEVGGAAWSGPNRSYRLRIPCDYDFLGSNSGEFDGEEELLAPVRGNTNNWHVVVRFPTKRVRYVRMLIKQTYPRFDFKPEGLSRDVLAWLLDEPDSGLADRHTPPQRVVRLAEQTLRDAPRVRFATRPCKPDSNEYNQQADVLGTGPVWKPSRRPTWSVLAVRYHDTTGAKRDMKRPGWILKRPPTPMEERIQSYSVVAEGAKGIWYWHYGSFTWGRAAEGPGIEGVRQIGLDDPGSAELWKEIARIGAELRAVGPYLARADQGQPLDTENEDIEATLFRSGLDTWIVVLLNIREAGGGRLRNDELSPTLYIAREKLVPGAPPMELAPLKNIWIEAPAPDDGKIEPPVAVRHDDLLPLKFKRKAGKVAVFLPELKDCLAIVVTASARVVAEVKERLEGFRPELEKIGAMDK